VKPRHDLAVFDPRSPISTTPHVSTSLSVVSKSKVT